MSSLEIIKQELIKQKNMLENKGFPVSVSNINPSPTDISNAINNIDIRFSETTATEYDVLKGKTFISKTQGIKTGVLEVDNADTFQNIIKTLIAGEGDSLDISQILPAGITQIRPYAFRMEPVMPANLYYATDFVLPNTVLRIGNYAFYKFKFTGNVKISNSCTHIGDYGLAYATFSTIELDSTISTIGNYPFYHCDSLKRITFSPNSKNAPTPLFSHCVALEEVVIQNSIFPWQSNTVYGTNAMKRMIFETAEPITLKSGAFQNFKTIYTVVPYEYYDTYFNATNYRQYSNEMYGFGNFLTGIIPPASTELYTLTWYPSFEDLEARTNPVTQCTFDGRYYAVFTPIETGEEE